MENTCCDEPMDEHCTACERCPEDHCPECGACVELGWCTEGCDNE